MPNKPGLIRSLRWTALILLCAVVVGGCPAKPEPQPEPEPEPEPRADGVAVTSTSPEFSAAARGLERACNLPAEFGRCGCTLDGFQAPCDLVILCLEVGFCELAPAEQVGTSVTSDSPTFKTAVKTLEPVCNISAEFGRCGCFLDGIRTSCDFVKRCLENGFCVRAST